MDEISNITELPLDILVSVFPYLDAKSFLAFCSTCKAFQQPSIRLDSAFWSYQTRSTFRIPNQPVVQHDGDRWQKMYKRLFTQTRVYTWGSESNHRLGHHTHARSCPIPEEMQGAQELGIIADLQCGGWSTTILNSKGILSSVGVLDGERNFGGNADLTKLQFPPGYPQSNEPTTTIRQFSAGRSHILGVSDSGRIWSWHDMDKPAVQIKFANIDINEESSIVPKKTQDSQYGTVKQVVAGWSYSSAYVRGVGIVVWHQHRPRPGHHGPRRALSVPRRPTYDEAEPDTLLLLENFESPKTRYQRPKGAARESARDRVLGAEVGQVENYILLENFLVFVTDIGKVFCSKFDEKDKTDNILELYALRTQSGKALDVQGSFRRFATFRDGEVIIAEQDYLDACWNARMSDPEQTEVTGLKRIPALQHNNVVSVAFGDFHFLALHSTGKITSYGKEVQARGALGLGSMPACRLRGLDLGRHTRQDLELLRHAYTYGREIWFRSEQRDWLKSLINGVGDMPEPPERWNMFVDDPDVAGEISEWIEQEGKAWDEDKGEDGLGAYFALRVSAAGWHSGAVLLVNEDLANKATTYDWRNKSFPRLKLSSGEMPGTGPFDEWREGVPEWKLDWELS